MYSYIHAVFIILLTEKLYYSTGYQWLPLRSGDPIPEEAILIDPEYQSYVGRARHFNSLLPAEVYNSTHSYALISTCYQELVKNQFEVLVTMESCCWQSFNLIEELPANVVRAGTAKNGEPIFIGKSKRIVQYSRWDSCEEMWDAYVQEDPNFRITSIYLTSDDVVEWQYSPKSNKFSLICDDNNTWVDTSSAQLPSNAIYGGKSKKGDEIFVARILSGCTTIPGQVIPRLGIASAIYGESEIQSPFCQVLVGDSDKYDWVSAENGEIPEHAVVAGKFEKRELMYLVRANRTLGYISHSQALTYTIPYEILVKSLE